MPHFSGRNHARRERYFAYSGGGGEHQDRAARADEIIPEHEIAALAYSYWEALGRQHGSAWEDWFRAERELKARRGL